MIDWICVNQLSASARAPFVRSFFLAACPTGNHPPRQSACLLLNCQAAKKQCRAVQCSERSVATATVRHATPRHATLRYYNATLLQRNTVASHSLPEGERGDGRYGGHDDSPQPSILCCSSSFTFSLLSVLITTLSKPLLCYTPPFTAIVSLLV